MPDLPPATETIVAVARIALLAYATVATILTTACLALHAITAFDRRFTPRALAASSSRRAGKRSLFVSLEADGEDA